MDLYALGAETAEQVQERLSQGMSFDEIVADNNLNGWGGSIFPPERAAKIREYAESHPNDPALFDHARYYDGYLSRWD